MRANIILYVSHQEANARFYDKGLVEQRTARAWMDTRSRLPEVQGVGGRLHGPDDRNQDKPKNGIRDGCRDWPNDGQQASPKNGPDNGIRDGCR